MQALPAPIRFDPWFDHTERHVAAGTCRTLRHNYVASNRFDFMRHVAGPREIQLVAGSPRLVASCGLSSSQVLSQGNNQTV